MSVRLPEHDHCKFCGDPVPFDQAYCSEECYRNEGARVKKERNRNILFVVACAVSMAVIISISLFVRFSE